MKKFLFSLLAATLLLGAGCSKDDDKVSTKESSFILGGKTYKFSDAMWIDNLGQGYYNISDESEDMKNKFSIDIAEKSVKSFTAGEGKNSITLTVEGELYRCKSGTITITRADSKIIEGTFTGKFYKGFETSNTVDATGTFSAVYPI
jgi:hypothetical protein